jgi:esterase/lipase superfamily enzyme
MPQSSLIPAGPRPGPAARHRRLRTGLAVALMLAAGASRAQSVELVRAYQNFEIAKAENKLAQALSYGDDALRLQVAQDSDAQDRIKLLCSLGEYAAQAGEDARALQYYERALEQQQAALGSDHPDLVPILTALAELHARAADYADAETILKRILSIEQAAYGEPHPYVVAALERLRGIYQAAGDTDAVANTEEKLRTQEAQLRAGNAAKRGLAPVKGGVVVGSNRYQFNKDGYAAVRVFYGTNRAPAGDGTLSPYYGKVNGALQYGYVTVTIPQSHKLAELETPEQWSDFLFGVTATPDKRKYVLLEKVTPLGKDAFLTALHQQIGDSRSKDAFIFIHGFNTSFEDAARRTAQLAYDMDFDGTPIMYSWPSQGSASAYIVDEGVIDVSVIRMAQFLDAIAAQFGAEHIHLIAHSMGNRVLIGALQRCLQARTGADHPRAFGQIVFAAPDVDRDYFIAATESMTGMADRLTLYASDSDRALQASQIMHSAPRAGFAGATIVRLAGVDTIDMSGVPADLLGHSYFASNGGAVYDLLHLLWRGEAPGSPSRCGKSDTAFTGPLVVWRFDVQKCQGDDLLEAAILLKQLQNLGQQQIVTQISAQISGMTDPLQQQAGRLILERVNQLLQVLAPATTGVVR